MTDSNGLHTAVNLEVHSSERRSKRKNKEKKSKKKHHKRRKQTDVDNKEDMKYDSLTMNLTEFTENTGDKQVITSDQQSDLAGERKIGWQGDGTEVMGSFTKEENEALKQFMSRYMARENLTEDDIRERVWTPKRIKDSFWMEMAEYVPNRTLASLYKHVRRMYHKFETRAKWTKEEDQYLKELYETKGSQWKEIGILMDRMPEDCRDRWRNYLKCGTVRSERHWSKEEEDLLRNAVESVIAKHGKINWTLASEYMNGKRSRLQCAYKWKKLSQTQPKD